jgi:hypothetical protein
MDYITPIGSPDDFIEQTFTHPRLYRCPSCGTKGRRVRIRSRRIHHVGPPGRKSWLVGHVGVYKAACGCCQYFQAPMKEAPAKGLYSYGVRNMIANALIRDRMPYSLVQRRLAEDHHLSVSVGFIHACFEWAHQQIDTEAYWSFVVANFSGVLCVDEVHDSGRTVLMATDPLGDFTVAFRLVEKNDQAHLNGFLSILKARGVEAQVVITDGSPLYKDCLQHHWASVEHQLCIFHVIKEVNTLLLDGVRAVKNQRRRQGNKGRKRKPGRPTRAAQHQRRQRKTMTKHEQATFIWEHQYLIVKKTDQLTDDDQTQLGLLLEIAPELALLRRFTQQFYRLFESGITQQQARTRRTRMVNNADYQAHPQLAKALKKLSKKRFEKMIVFLGWDGVDRTNNHVERANRVFRMLQKTRYKRRKAHTLKHALELDLYARMLRHPLYHPVRGKAAPSEDAARTERWKKAA